MKEFEILEHTADIGIAAYGKTKREVLINVARGMFEIIAGGTKNLKENFYDKIKLEADNLEGLLFAWLNELLYISETKLVILNKFEIKDLSNNKIGAEVKGTKINQLGCKIRKEIKAVTY
ncbi:archease, partial [bacterium]|nr:archease [bacterium]